MENDQNENESACQTHSISILRKYKKESKHVSCFTAAAAAAAPVVINFIFRLVKLNQLIKAPKQKNYQYNFMRKQSDKNHTYKMSLHVRNQNDIIKYEEEKIKE